jgi:hypothetical protein
MSGGNDDFIRQMMGMVQLKTQIDQVQSENRARQSNILNTIFGLARQTQHPEQQAALMKAGSLLSGLPEETTQQMFKDTAPMADVTASHEAQVGLANMTPTERANVQRLTAYGELTKNLPANVARSNFIEGLFNSGHMMPGAADAFVTQTATGQTPGAFSLDQALSLKSPQELNRAASIQLNTVLGATGQEQARQANQQNQVNWAGNRVQWADVATRAAGQELTYTADLARIRSAGQQAGALDTVHLLEAQNDAMKWLGTSKATSSQWEANQAAQAINQISEELRKRGVRVPAPLDINQVAPPSSLFGWPGPGQ